ncbi:MAG TPA: serine hydrolase [Balneolales bacterium]|nr:serine hydrolase [Balneolales bacterium]
MKLIKFIGVFLAVILILGLIIYIPNQSAFKTIFSNSKDLEEGSNLVQRSTTDKGLINYMKAYPGNVGLVSFSTGKSDSSIYYQAGKKRVMGSTSNLLLIIEYARRVDNRSLNPDEPVRLSEINKYNIPKYYSANHKEAVTDLKNNHQISKNGTIPLHDVIGMLVQSNDFAASDYLYFKLSPDSIRNLPNILHTKNIEFPVPWSGQVISWKASLYHQTNQQRLHTLKNMSKEKYDQLALNNSKKLNDDKAFRDKVTKAFQSNGLGSAFSYEKKLYQLSPKATPRAMANLLQQINNGSLINAHVSLIIKKALQWSFDAQSLKKQIVYYGGLFDSRMGILNGIDMGKLVNTKSTRIQVVYLNDVPVSLWMHLSSNFTNQTMQREMIWKPSFYHYVYNKLAH